ncbi:protein DpdG [Massilia sp. CMS3.1]|uniref:protein DpdG n=1 Tax=Massilia sp. CMS3.1 TaxID=3373083 RepID=UPI003EE5794B
MTIINLTNDGLHAQLIVLARVAAKFGPINRDELIRVCAAPGDDGKDRDVARLRTTLARWIELGLFIQEADAIRVNLELKRGFAIDELTDRLPATCRRLVLQDQHCLPLWGTGEDPTEKGVGRAADFARGLAWALAQDIYSLPEGGKDIEALDRSQATTARFIFLNHGRWPGLRPWARYLGFGNGDGSSFLFDPTEAVRDELPHIIGNGKAMAAEAFIGALGARLPVLDGGTYRKEVEANLRSDRWRGPESGHLSMSLSFALRRLDLDGTIKLETLADAGAVVKLSGRDYRTWASFTQVRLAGDRA